MCGQCSSTARRSDTHDVEHGAWGSTSHSFKWSLSQQHYIMEQPTQESAQAQRGSPAMRGTSPWSSSTSARVSVGHTLAERPARQLAAWHWCSAEAGAVHTGVYSLNAPALHRSRHSLRLPSLTDRRPGLGLCFVSFFMYCNGYVYIFDVRYCRVEGPQGTLEVSVFPPVHEHWHHVF